MMLVTNSCLTILGFGCILLRVSIFTFQNDFNQIQYQDSLCSIRAYFNYAFAAILNYSFFIQAFYRYIIQVYYFMKEKKTPSKQVIQFIF